MWKKAYDMLWVEGLLIKMHMLGIGGNMGEALFK